MSAERREMNNSGQQEGNSSKRAITAIRLVCLASLVAAMFVLAPQTSRSQSQTLSMQIVAGLASPGVSGESVGFTWNSGTCPNNQDVCILGGGSGVVGEGACPGEGPFSGFPSHQPGGPVPVCNFGYAGDGGPAIDALLGYPLSVAADASGNVYIADAANSVVRKIDSAGNISTYGWVDSSGNFNLGAPSAGTAVSCVTNNACTGGGSNLGSFPRGDYPAVVAVDPQGGVHVRVVTGGSGGVQPLATVFDASGNEYDLVEQLGAWYGISKNGIPLFCSTSAPSCNYRVFQFDTFLTGLAVDGSGNIYTIESGGTIVEMNPTAGTATPLVTIPSQLVPITPTENVPASPLAADSTGNLYVLTNAASSNGAATVSEYNATSQTWTTIAGTGADGFNNGNAPNDTGAIADYSPAVDVPSPATQTDLNNATAISMGFDGALYIADTENNMIRKIPGVAPSAGGGCQECGPTSLAITDTITRPLPTQWGINPSLHKIYAITSANPGVVTVYSTQDDSVIANIPVPGPGVTQSAGASTNLAALTVDPVNNLVWVTDSGTNAVWVIDSATDTLNPTSVALPAAPVDIAVDTALNKAYVTNTEGGYSFAGFPAAVTVISGPGKGAPPAVVAGIGAYGSAGGALTGATAVVADPQRHFVYVRYTGGSNLLGYQGYSLAQIDSTKDQIINTAYLGQTQFQTTIFPDSLAVNESNGQVLIGDDYDQYVHLYDPNTQQLSGFFGYEGYYPYHAAADSLHGIFYTWDGYGNTGYITPNQNGGSITSTTNTSPGESTVAVDQSTDQAYVLNCNSTNGDGTFGTMTLFDGAAKIVQTTLSLEIPSVLNNENEYCGGLLVDASNSNPAQHSAWAGFAYASQDPTSGNITTTGQIDVINGGTPAARPSISFLFGNPLGIDFNPAPFQDVGVGQTATQLVRIKNNGPGPLNSLSFDIQDLQDSGSLQIANNGCVVSVAQPLPAGGQCSFELTFTPSQVENFSGAVLVLDNAGDTPQSIAVNGTGVPDTGGLTIAPNFLPPGVVGQSYGQVFSASGLIGTPTWSISGTLPPDLTFAPALHWIVSSPNILAAADVGTWSFTISVTDSANGNTASQLYALTIASTASGQATAAVTIPGSSANANTLAFGSIEVNEPSATQQISVQNSYTSAANLQISSVMLTGPNAGDFQESDNCVGQSLVTYQSCAISVTFLPTVAPTANEVAEIIVGSNAAIAPIYLTGTSAPALGAPSPLPVLVSADNGNPPNPATALDIIGCYPPECGSSGPTGNLGGVSSGGKFAAFSFLAGNLPGPPPATTSFSGAANGAYLRKSCVGAAPGTCEESTQFIAYGPTLGTAPGSNGGRPCEDLTSGGSSGSQATGIDSSGEFVLFESDSCGFGGSNSTNAHQIYLRDALYGNTTLVSVDATGTTVLDHGASGSSTSSDARFFTFQSASTNAVSGFINPNGNREVYWRDTCLSEGNPVSPCTKQTILISQDNPSDGFNDNSFDSSISASGRYVVFGSYATMLNSTPANSNTTGLEQIYLYDTCAGAPSGQNCTPSTRLISVDANGNPVGGSSPKVSTDGRFVTFLSSAATLLPTAYQAQDGGITEVYLADTCVSSGTQVTGCTTQPPVLVSQNGGIPGDLNSSGLAISADGQLVTFTSGAPALLSGGIVSVYEYTNCLSPAAAPSCAPGLQVISVDANGNPLQNITGGAVLDPTGQYFIFDGQQAPGSSYAGAPEVYLATTTLVPPPPAIATFSPFNAGIDFVTVNVGTTSPTAALELTDTGAGPLHVYLMTLLNSQTLQSAPFNLKSILCNASPGGTINIPETVQYAVNLTLDPGISCVFNITMNPTAPGTFNGSINFATNASQSNAPIQLTSPDRSQISIPITGTAPADADLSISSQATAEFGTTGLNVSFSSLTLDNGSDTDTNTTVTYTFSSAVQFESFSVQASGSTPNSCTLPAAGAIITTFSCNLGSIVFNGSFAGSFAADITVSPVTAGQLTMTATVSGDLFDPNTANNTATSAAVLIALGPANVNDQETIHVDDQEAPNQSIPGLVAFVGDPETINVKDQEAPNQSIPGLVAYVGDSEPINVKDSDSPKPPCSVDISSQVKITRSGLTPKYQKIGTSYVQVGYVQTLTVTNTTASVINGPFQIEFGNLPSGVSVSYTNGTAAQTTTCNSPSGAPYLNLTVPVTGALVLSLSPNSSVNLYVLFIDPTRAAFSAYTANVLEGTNP
jgi:hypothetical protein